MTNLSELCWLDRLLTDTDTGDQAPNLQIDRDSVPIEPGLRRISIKGGERCMLRISCSTSTTKHVGSRPHLSWTQTGKVKARSMPIDVMEWDIVIFSGQKNEKNFGKVAEGEV